MNFSSERIRSIVEKQRTSKSTYLEIKLVWVSGAWYRILNFQMGAKTKQRKRTGQIKGIKTEQKEQWLM